MKRLLKFSGLCFCVLTVFFSVVPLGCFSQGIRHGFLWGPGEHQPTPTETVLAGAADALTLPMQAPLLLAHKLSRAQERQKDAYLARIRADPGIVLKEGPYRGVDNPRWQAVLAAVKDPTVAFTDAQLRKLHAEAELPGDAIPSNPHCSEALLREILASIQGLASQYEAGQLTALLANPKLPRDLLETIAADPARFGRFSAQARQMRR